MQLDQAQSTQGFGRHVAGAPGRGGNEMVRYVRKKVEDGLAMHEAIQDIGNLKGTQK